MLVGIGILVEILRRLGYAFVPVGRKEERAGPPGRGGAAADSD